MFSDIDCELFVCFSLGLKVQNLPREESAVSCSEKIPEVFLPVLWFDAEAAIDEEMASQVKMLAVMPTAGLLFGVISLAGAALCLVLFLYLRQKKVTSSVTPSATPAEKVDISIDMRSKTLRTPVVETSQI